MVYLFHRCHPTFPETAFTQGVVLNIPVTDALPRSTVLLVHIGAALVAVILFPV